MYLVTEIRESAWEAFVLNWIWENQVNNQFVTQSTSRETQLLNNSGAPNEVIVQNHLT